MHVTVVATGESPKEFAAETTAAQPGSVVVVTAKTESPKKGEVLFRAKKIGFNFFAGSTGVILFYLLASFYEGLSPKMLALGCAAGVTSRLIHHTFLAWRDCKPVRGRDKLLLLLPTVTFEAMLWGILLLTDTGFPLAMLYSGLTFFSLQNLLLSLSRSKENPKPDSV